MDGHRDWGNSIRNHMCLSAVGEYRNYQTLLWTVCTVWFQNSHWKSSHQLYLKIVTIVRLSLHKIRLDQKILTRIISFANIFKREECVWVIWIDSECFSGRNCMWENCWKSRNFHNGTAWAENVDFCWSHFRCNRSDKVNLCWVAYIPTLCGANLQNGAV